MRVRELEISNDIGFELYGLSASNVCSKYLSSTIRDLVTGDCRTVLVPKIKETSLPK